MCTSWQVLRVLQGLNPSQLVLLPRTFLLAGSDLQTTQEGNCWKERMGEGDVFLTPHIKVFHMVFFQYQLVTSSCLTWTVGWFYSVLYGSFSSHPDATKGWKEQWKMQKVTDWGMDVFRSCNLLAHFHQAQWHSMCIRLSEHCQEKEKDHLKSNKNQTILLVYLK